MSNDFKPGTVVQLKSGGPKLTVTAVKNENVWCSWFSGHEVKNHNFTAESLQEAKPATHSYDLG